MCSVISKGSVKNRYKLVAFIFYWLNKNQPKIHEHIYSNNTGTTSKPKVTLRYQKIDCFSVECRKTETKVITLANHKEHTQYSEPIKTQSNYR